MDTLARQLLEQVGELKKVLRDRATGQGRDGDDEVYKRLRGDLLKSNLASRLPQFVKDCRDMDDFWSFIKPKFQTYLERKTYLTGQFGPLLDELEALVRAPADGATTAILATFDVEHVAAAWNKALARRESDPEGAITMARTLLETVCKQILDRAGEAYAEKTELPALYSRAAAAMNLAPSQHTELIFKQILGGCQAIVEGLGALRNKLSDAHGRGVKGVKPQSRHAALAVTLAGGMATFLVETWLARAARITGTSP